MFTAAPRRVIVVSDYAHVTGGASKVALRSAIGLARRGYDAHLFAAVGPVAPELREAGVTIHCLAQENLLNEADRLSAAGRGLWNLRARNALRRLLAGFDPRETVVHFHQWTHALSPSAFTPVFDAGIRLVATMHDYFISCPQGGFLVYPKGAVCHRQPLSLNCLICACDRRNHLHKLWRCLRQGVQNRVLMAPNGLRHLIYVSEFGRTVLSGYLPPHVQWHFVPNPVDAKRAERLPIKDNREFIFVGRLAREKGGVLFAEAARQAQVRCVFIGDGDEREDIQRINPDAELTGWLEPAAVYRRMATARAIVFPSIWYEMHGLVVAEAAAMGVPAIVSDRCAAREFIHDGVTGLLVHRGSVDDLVRAMQVLTDDDVADRLSRAAYDGFWQDPPDLDNHVDYLEETYRSIFAGP